jgi:hypothetical protein
VFSSCTAKVWVLQSLAVFLIGASVAGCAGSGPTPSREPVTPTSQASIYRAPSFASTASSKAATMPPGLTDPDLTIGDAEVFRATSLVDSSKQETLVAVLVTNSGKGSVGFELDGAVSSTYPISVSGWVKDLRPGETRAAILSTALGVARPGDPIEVRLASEDRLLVLSQTAKQAAAVRFGALTYNPNIGFLYQGRVNATNTGTATMTISAGAAFTRDGKLVGFARGSVKDLGPGQTLIVPVQVVGEPLATDTAVCYVDQLTG